MNRQVLQKDERKGGDRSKTMIETVVGRLREDILAGEYAPGSRLHVDKLRERFGVGVSTVREALSRLMIERLVTSESQRGFRVAPVSLDDFMQVAEMRKILEKIAVTKSIEQGDDDWEAGIVSAFHLLSRAEERRIGGGGISDPSEWSRLNKKFHDALVGACGNRWLMEFRRTLHDQSERYIRISLREMQIEGRDVHKEHQEIYKSVLDRDAVKAAELIENHIENTVSVVSAKLSSIGMSAEIE